MLGRQWSMQWRAMIGRNTSELSWKLLSSLFTRIHQCLSYSFTDIYIISLLFIKWLIKKWWRNPRWKLCVTRWKRIRISSQWQCTLLDIRSKSITTFDAVTQHFKNLKDKNKYQDLNDMTPKLNSHARRASASQPSGANTNQSF
jgi:hypothetical protein